MVMAKGKTKKKKSGVVTQQTIIRRMLAAAGGDLLGICILQTIRQDGRWELAFVNHWLVPLAVFFGIASAASLVWLIMTLVKKTDTSRWTVTPVMALCVSVFCLIASLIYTYVFPGAIIIASVACTVLFLVYCLYMHIFYR